jgi:hypothetical protein
VPPVNNGGISPGQKWWRTVIEIEISCSQWEGSACTQSFGWGGGGGGKDFFSFFLCSQHVPFKFPMGSHQFPNVFSLSCSLFLQWANEIGSLQKKSWSCEAPPTNQYETEWVLPVYAPTISLGQKWRHTVLETKVSCSQWEGSAFTLGVQFSSWGGGGREGFFAFFPVPNVFLSSSQRLAQGLKLFTQDVPNSTSDLSRWAIGEHICFYFAIRVQRGVSIGECPNVPKKLPTVHIEETNQYGSFKEKVVSTPMN